jgi:rare lipoprotein A
MSCRFGPVVSLLACCTALLLTACSGTAGRQPDRAELPGRASPPQKAGKPASPGNRRGGAYYKDDGPADEIPVDLDSIPEPDPRLEPLHKAANRPYVVLGKSYVPNTSLKPHQQRGIASWYGKKFHGQKTSIGETYDMFSMTAAHPTLAIPSYVRVSNPGNGKSVVVRVTDRGPFLHDRIIDLSYAAAYRLGYVDNGSALVDIRSILPGDPTGLTYAQVKPPDPPSAKPVAPQAERDEIEDLARRLAAEETPGTATATPTMQRGVFLQLGAFSSADNAESLRSHFSRELDWLTEGIQINPAGGIHRVQIGPYSTRADAEKVADKIRVVLGQKPGIVVR